LRYTMEIGETRYTQTVSETLTALKKKGYKVTQFKNTWGVPGQPTPICQGINTNIVTPTGQTFELQFHTQTSFHTKEVLNHTLYEKWRLVDTSDSIKLDLFGKMQANQAAVTVPEGVVGLTI